MVIMNKRVKYIPKTVFLKPYVGYRGAIYAGIVQFEEIQSMHVEIYKRGQEFIACTCGKK